MAMLPIDATASPLDRGHFPAPPLAGNVRREAVCPSSGLCHRRRRGELSVLASGRMHGKHALLATGTIRSCCLEP